MGALTTNSLFPPLFCTVNNTTKLFFVQFTQGHCIKYKSTFIKRAKSIRQVHPEIEFHAISCLHHDEICRERFAFEVYPSLFVIPAGIDATDYSKVALPIGQDLEWENVEEGLDTAQRNLEQLESEDDSEEAETAVLSQPNVIDHDNAFPDSDEENGDEEEEEQPDIPVDEDEEDVAEQEEEVADEEADEEAEEEEEEGAEEEEDPQIVSDFNYETEDADSDDEDQLDSKDQAYVESLLEERRKNKIRHQNMKQTNDEYPEKKEYSDVKRMREDRYKKGLPVPPSPYVASGARLARQKPKDASAFESKYRENFKKRLEMRSKMRFWKKHKGFSTIEDPDEATTLMKANQVNTSEYDRRKQKFKEYVRKMKRKRKGIKFDPDSVELGKGGKLPYRKVVSRPRMVERLPVVKRVVHMSEEEELILDAGLAVFHGLKFDVFRGRNGPTPDQISVLKDWLDLLYVALPSEWGIQALVADLRQSVDSSLSFGRLSQILDRHRMNRMRWSKSCLSGSSGPRGGLACGYWKLFHVITVGVAEHRGGLNLIESEIRPRDTRTFSPMDAADTIRDYVANFFFCGECSENFVRDYADCEKNRRCDRLAVSQTAATDGDWKELALWLWEFHNDVSVRLLNAEADAKRKRRQKYFLLRRRDSPGPGIAAEADAIKVLWPNLDSCITCFKLDGSWNEPVVFQHLEKIYW